MVGSDRLTRLRGRTERSAPRRYEWPDLLSELPQASELQPVVAHHAGFGRASGEVFVGEVVLDASEGVLEVECMEGDIERIGDASCIGGVGGTAAALPMSGRAIDDGQFAVGFGVDAGAHEQADHFVTLLPEQPGGRRTIDSATHRQNHSSTHAPSLEARRASRQGVGLQVGTVGGGIGVCPRRLLGLGQRGTDQAAVQNRLHQPASQRTGHSATAAGVFEYDNEGEPGVVGRHVPGEPGVVFQVPTDLGRPGLPGDRDPGQSDSLVAGPLGVLDHSFES